MHAEALFSVYLYITENLARHEDLEDLVTLSPVLQYQSFEAFHQVTVYFIASL